jgi:Ca2+-transporting ATPase
LQYLLAGNAGELLLMTLCIIIGLPTPLLPIHLLWINLVTDGLPALCLASDPIDSEVMRRRPRPRNERITDGGFLPVLLLTGALTAGVSFLVYLYGLRSETPELARTHAFAALVFAELLRSFGARSDTRPIWRMNLLSNFNLLVVVAASFCIQVWSHHSPFLASILKTTLVPLRDCLMLLAVSSVPLLVLELHKLVTLKQAAPPPA